MNLLCMSFSASVIIMVIIVLRALWLYQLPKKMFLVLWFVAVLRLLMPFSFPSMFSAYFLISQNSAIMDRIEDTSIIDFLPILSQNEKGDFNILENESPVKGTVSAEMGIGQGEKWSAGTVNKPVQGVENKRQGEVTGSGMGLHQYQEDNHVPILGEGYAPVWTIIWALGMSVCILFFFITYILCCRRFRISLPVENDIINEWMLSHKIRRRISVRQSDCISSPLAYGFFRPVILMPKATKWENSRQLQYILEHEFIHIRRLDAVAKLFLIAAVCIHWFNPMVWIMYILANRDIELSCDEGVIKQFGAASRSAYALSLIHMEEMKSGLMPLGNNFSKNAAEERITAIMKLQKLSVTAYILAAVIVISVTAIFATSATAIGQEGNKKQAEMIDGQQANIGTDTELSEKQQKELLMEYQKYGVSEDKGILYYQGKAIRSLVDKYLETTYKENGARNVDTVRVYTYFNEAGTVDVKAVREDKAGKTKIRKIFREVTNIVELKPTAVTNIVIDIPRESVNRLARNAAEESRYTDVKKIISYVDTDVVDEIAEKMVGEEERIDEIVSYVSADFIGELTETAYRKWGFSFVRRLLPHVPQETLSSLAKMAEEKKDDAGMRQIKEFIEE